MKDIGVVVATLQAMDEHLAACEGCQCVKAVQLAVAHALVGDDAS